GCPFLGLSTTLEGRTMTRYRLVTAAALVLAAGAGAPGGEPAKKDRNSLQGFWDVVAVERDGGKSRDRQDQGLKFIFTGDKLTLDRGGKRSHDAKYKLDPGAKEKGIDVTFITGPSEGQTFRGIYELEGDNLKICWSRGGQKGPTKFATARDSGQVLYTLKR